MTQTDLTFDVYLQDPLVAAQDPRLGFQEIEIRNEPNISDGPTSARFAVVDYNGQTGRVADPAKWDGKKGCFRKGNRLLNWNFKPADALQFHQVHAWAIAQQTLQFFEENQAMGRPIPWGFPGNRLIIVPHAGYGQNAYYDRASKSLQFYYFNRPDRPEQQVFTCLSADIVHHEFGHAVLDGIRPGFLESYSMETAAFHEFVGDLTAILMLLRNNDFRQKIVDDADNTQQEALDTLSNIAEEFGQTVRNRPYLRSARNKLRMDDPEVQASTDPHFLSNVLTGACFDILMALSAAYIQRLETRTNSKAVAREAFWYTIQRAQRTLLQPLDFLPPVDGRFRDYALAVLRSQDLSDPKDPYEYRALMVEVFVRRGILTEEEGRNLLKPAYLFDRNNPAIPNFHWVSEWSKSKAAAYRFLDDNRKAFAIPQYRDFEVLDLYQSEKYGRQNHLMPRQYILEYGWHEEIRLDDTTFAEQNGQFVALPCGGTLVFDENNNLLHWAMKPGTECTDNPILLAQGKERRAELLKNLAGFIQNGHIGNALEGEIGILAQSIYPLRFKPQNGCLHLELAPHFDLSEDSDPTEKQPWRISF